MIKSSICAVSRARALPMVLGVSLALSGLTSCAADMPSPPATDRFLLETVRQNHHVTFALGSSKLDAVQQRGLSIFLDEADPNGRGMIYLDAKGDMGADRVDAVAASLDSIGRRSAGSIGGEGSVTDVTVTIVQDVLLPGACLKGDGWPDPRLSPAGCAQALMLMDMVEDQDDLIHGRILGPASGQSAAEAVWSQRSRTSTNRLGDLQPTTGEQPQSSPSSAIPRTSEAGY